ncbi:hypothetical protein BURMUCGD1_0401 [Burkholderia multivorans CGD1]|nr:hypothetical protein BURMUCGD1_0401 [Burkholderia multivorans CGD1]
MPSAALRQTVAKPVEKLEADQGFAEHARERVNAHAKPKRRMDEKKPLPGGSGFR